MSGSCAAVHFAMADSYLLGRRPVAAPHSSRLDRSFGRRDHYTRDLRR
jgi:hypothetical protein